METQPPTENVITLSRCYAALERDNNYKRRVTGLGSLVNAQSYAIVEYLGKYPNEVAPHGNSKHQNTMFVRTKPTILAKISKLSDGSNIPRQMVLDNPFEAPRDFKQVRNVKYQK